MPRHERTGLPSRLKLFLFAFLILIGGFLLFRGIQYLPVLYQYFFQKDIELRQTKDQRVNILLLGIGGGKHEGPLLTDTIIFASLDPQKNQVTMITIPRDLWVPELEQKINVAYTIGDRKKDGGGLLLSKALVSRIVGQKVDYGFRVDFNGFIKAVDLIGGIDVAVERAFDDYEYPLSGKEADTCGFEGEEFEKRATEEAQLEAFPCRYEHLHFEKGVQHIDGETALKYVRSRHAKGPEGTDFARSMRQEKVINAVKDKVFSAGTLLNPIKLVSLYEAFQDSIDTDIEKKEYDDFVKLAQKMKGATTKSYVMDYGDDQQGRPGLLINPPITDEFNNQWVIIPRSGNGNYNEIHNFIACVLEGAGEECVITPTNAPISDS